MARDCGAVWHSSEPKTSGMTSLLLNTPLGSRRCLSLPRPLPSLPFLSLCSCKCRSSIGWMLSASPRPTQSCTLAVNQGLSSPVHHMLSPLSQTLQCFLRRRTEKQSPGYTFSKWNGGVSSQSWKKCPRKTTCPLYPCAVPVHNSPARTKERIRFAGNKLIEQDLISITSKAWKEQPSKQTATQKAEHWLLFSASPLSLHRSY